MALQRLGPFELLRVLGRGGMGTVYEARESGDSRLVAVKALAPAYSFDEKFRNRFEAEIDALMSLDHENIVRLLSYGQDEGNMFFAMELVDGSSLFQEQKKGHVFHWQEIIDIAIQVCDGLRHAHDRGIIHRDLKPGNIMVTADRQIKITDFGIAKSFGSSSLTSEGNVLGTMDFMAPEQARGKNTNAKSDLFSLGAVMYSLLAGRPPFLRETIEDTFEALLSPKQPDQLDKVAPDTPIPLAQLIHRLMEKEPGKRIATAQATGRQLGHVKDMVKNVPNEETQVIPGGHDLQDSANTQVITDETGSLDLGNTSEQKRPLNQPTSVSRKKAAAETDDMQSRQPDYFNQVTPQQRQKKTELITSDEKESSVWPIVLALLCVIGISIAGVWYSLFRQPSKESLLAAINNNHETPFRVQEELEQFIKWYSEEEEIEYVTEQWDRVEVTRYYKRLRARKNISTKNQLTPAELKFYQIHQLSEESVPDALTQLDSFLQFYEKSEGLDSKDSRAIEMARRIRVHWDRKASTRVKQDQIRVQHALDRGRSSNNVDDAKATFQSIINVNEGFYWVKDLVQEARDELAKLQNN